MSPAESEPKRRRRQAMLSEIEEILYKSDDESIQLIPPFEAKPLNFAEKMAYIVSDCLGSWRFMIFLASIVAFWIFWNLFMPHIGFDSHPFTLLNLMLGIAAAFQAPIILMAANSQYRRDIQRDSYHHDVQIATEAELRAAYDRLNSIELGMAVAGEEANYLQDNMNRGIKTIDSKMENLLDGIAEYKSRVDKISEDVKLIQGALEVMSRNQLIIIKEISAKATTEKLKENEHGREYAGNAGTSGRSSKRKQR